ncbi:unnamed protein product [Closterium sp. Naga37s-1]|nr:unnamed protein product [Closterium sp. Naga37s-1]
MQNRTLEKQGLDATSVYSLFLYREGRAWGGSSSEEEEEKSLCGAVPVLFIPGNAGCYKQVRSLASVSHHIYHASHAQHESRNSPPCFACGDDPHTEPLTPVKPAADSDGKKESGEARGEGAAGTGKGGRGSAAYPCRLVWFSVDLREHLSALHTALLHKQAAFVAAAVTQILSLYSASCASTPAHPPSVLLVGHSMGGIVARLAHRRLRGGGGVREGRNREMEEEVKGCAWKDEAQEGGGGIQELESGRCSIVHQEGSGHDSVHTIVTIATPHSLFPLPLQPSMHALYHSLIQHTPNSPSSALLLASLAAGRSDWQVRFASCHVSAYHWLPCHPTRTPIPPFPALSLLLSAPRIVSCWLVRLAGEIGR